MALLTVKVEASRQRRVPPLPVPEDFMRWWVSFFLDLEDGTSIEWWFTAAGTVLRWRYAADGTVLGSPERFRRHSR